MKKASDLINLSSTTNSSKPQHHISEEIRKIFSIFRLNYKQKFESQYPDAKSLQRTMILWSRELHIPEKKLMKAAQLCVNYLEWPPNLAEFKRMCKEVHIPEPRKLPPPKRTAQEKEKGLAQLKKLRRTLCKNQ